VARLGQCELKANNTPETVAYNFVNAILDGDYQRMLFYMDAEAANVKVLVVRENDTWKVVGFK